MESAHFSTLDIETAHTAELLELAVGPEAIQWMQTTDNATYEHLLGVGQLVRNVLEVEAYPKDFCDHVAVSTALHDIGKFRTDVLQLIRSPAKLSNADRDFVRKTHSTEGSLLLHGMELPLASFVAYEHHRPLPNDYPGGNRSTLYGITHLTKICDVMHALAFDQHRTYVAAREGRRPTPTDVSEMLMRDYAKNSPVILGHEINAVRAIQTQLQL
jgi:hypothetical protein